MEWSSLIAYYLSCLKREDSFDGLLQRSGTLSRYVFPADRRETVFSNPDSGLKVDDKLEKLIDAARLRGETLFYGYPVVILEDYSEGVRRRKLGCLLTIELGGIPRPGEAMPKTLHPKVDEPFFHPAVLSRLGVKSEQQNLLTKEFPPEQAMGTSEALSSYLSDLTRNLGLEAAEAINPMALELPDEGAVDGIGLVNTCIVFRAESSEYNRRLVDELQQLQGRGAETAKTAAAALIEYPGRTSAAEVAKSPVALFPIAANDAQRNAITAALREPLTVVTGPPGTGKSQLVANLIASAWASDQSVLLVSTNNQAVDVACTRAQAIQTGLVIRTGSKEHRDKARESLQSLLSNTTPLPDRAAVVAELKVNGQKFIEVRGQLNSRTVEETRLTEVVLGQEALDFNGRISNSQLPALLTRSASASRWLQRLRRVRAAWLLRQWRIKRLGKRFAIDINEFGDVLERYLELEVEKTALLGAIQVIPDTGVLVRRLLECQEGYRKSSAAYARLQIQRAVGQGRAAIAAFLQARVAGSHNGVAQAFPSVVPFLRAWASTALSVGATVPLTPGLFDLVIVDEASQCAIAQIIPALFRAKRAVIIGDAQQLSHISGLGWNDDKQRQAAAGLDESTVVAKKLSHVKHSIFDAMAQRAGPERTHLLDEHYRSHPEIIEISNKLFYGGRLTILTDPKTLLDFGQHAVAWRHVGGQAERPESGSAINREEAEAVVKEVASLLTRKRVPSVGVVTPFSAQARLIQNLLEKRLAPEAIASASLTVGTAHKFQGDERDVMVFSPVASEGLLPSTLNWLSGTPNLFNVAITRARSYLLVVGNLAYCRTLEGPLSALAQYAQERQTSQAVERAGQAGKIHSEPERRLYAALLEAGLAVEPKIQVRGYECDFVLTAGSAVINIECDGRHHVNESGRLRLQDRARDALISHKGWKVMRIPAWRCLLEPEKVVGELRGELSGDI